MKSQIGLIVFVLLMQLSVITGGPGSIDAEPVEPEPHKEKKEEPCETCDHPRECRVNCVDSCKVPRSECPHGCCYDKSIAKGPDCYYPSKTCDIDLQYRQECPTFYVKLIACRENCLRDRKGTQCCWDDVYEPRCYTAKCGKGNTC